MEGRSLARTRENLGYAKDLQAAISILDFRTPILEQSLPEYTSSSTKREKLPQLASADISAASTSSEALDVVS